MLREEPPVFKSIISPKWEQRRYSVVFADAFETSPTQSQEYEEAIADPETAQRGLLEVLLEDYCKTRYGESYGLNPGISLEEYRKKSPAVTYQELVPKFEQIRQGDYRVLLTEEPITWVMTRGTTGTSKILPVTENSHELIL